MRLWAQFGKWPRRWAYVGPAQALREPEQAGGCEGLSGWSDPVGGGMVVLALRCSEGGNLIRLIAVQGKERDVSFPSPGRGEVWSCHLLVRWWSLGREYYVKSCK